MGIFSKKTKSKKAEPAKAEAVVAVPGPREARASRSDSTKRVLIAPHVSEKASALEPAGTYVFRVRDEATKTLVKEEVERRYKVKVARVNIVRNRDARRFFRGRTHMGKIEKKALVTLIPGARIESK